MKTAPVFKPSSLVDRNGRQMGYWLYKSPRENFKQYRPRFYTGADTKTNVNAYDRWEMVNYSRQLASRVPEVGGSIVQKNRWAFGDAWDAHYHGENEKWGAEAKEFLDNQFFPNANLRGDPYDFFTSLFLSGVAFDRDGDDAMLLTQDENGFPKVAFVSATKIQSGQNAFGFPSASFTADGRRQTADIVMGGKFDGARMFDGVIFDRNNRMIGIRVMGEEGDYTDISAFSADLRYNPEWCDQGRGIPLLGRPLTKGLDFEDMVEFLTRAAKRACKWALTVKTESGDAVESGLTKISKTDIDITGSGGKDPKGNEVTERSLNIEEMGEEDALYLSSTFDESVEGIDFPVPHENLAEFMTGMLRAILFSIGWPLELYHLGLTSRAPTRLLCDVANTTIWGQQRALVKRWKRAVIYALAKGMKEGFLTANDDFRDWSRWMPGFPKTMTVDAGNDFAAAINNIKYGISAKQIETQRLFGFHHEEVDRMNDQNFRNLMKRTAENVKFAKSNGIELGPEKVIELLQQNYPNQQQPATARPTSNPNPNPKP